MAVDPDDVDVDLADDEVFVVLNRRGAGALPHPRDEDETLTVHGVHRGKWSLAFLRLNKDTARDVLRERPLAEPLSAEEFEQKLAEAPEPVLVRFDDPRAAERVASEEKHAELVDEPTES